jgi:hypothetical protein
MGLVDRRSSIIDHRSLGPNLTAGNERSRVAGETVRREGRWTSAGARSPEGKSQTASHGTWCVFSESRMPGNLPVRFDERQQETEPSQTGLRWRGESQVNQRPGDHSHCACSRLCSPITPTTTGPLISEMTSWAVSARLHHAKHLLFIRLVTYCVAGACPHVVCASDGGSSVVRNILFSDPVFLLCSSYVHRRK